jgi:transposase
MLGKQSPQRGLFDADHLYLDLVGKDTFYGFLALHRDELFHDEDFAHLYCADNGRDSVPPSLLALAMLLQTFDKVSDEEAKARADFDIRWKVALGLRVDERPFAKSTLQLFRAHLVLHEDAQRVFGRSLQLARKHGLMRRAKIKVALDTSAILGRGAVKDTYNLLADGILILTKALAAIARADAETWAREHGLARYFGSSLKGEAQIDWGDEDARRVFLNEVVTDADGLLQRAREVLESLIDEASRQDLCTAAELLEQLLLQDIERLPDGAAIRQGVSRDRMVSVHDPEMRHGHKSKSRRFDGHKMAVAVDTESQMIIAVDVLPGNAPDNQDALELVQQSEKYADAAVEETIADNAFGDGLTRQDFADAGRVLIARVPKRPKRAYLAKEDFAIDLETITCTCPGGQVTNKLVRRGRRQNRRGQVENRRAFQFDGEICASCSLQASCVKGKSGKGRTIALHPQEALLQQARAFQKSEAYNPYRKLRQVAEHRIARLVQLGARNARYFGRQKTLFQLLMAATVANLHLVAKKSAQRRGLDGDEGQPSSLLPTFFPLVRTCSQRFLSRLLAQPAQRWAFRLDF